MLWAAWRLKQSWKGNRSDRATGKHLARFILIGLYTGTRHAAICAASFERKFGRGYIDLERGIFERKALCARATNTRQPPVRLHHRLLAHLRRWHRLGSKEDAVVEWNGKSVKSIAKSFRRARESMTISAQVTQWVKRPHIARQGHLRRGRELAVPHPRGLHVEMRRMLTHTELHEHIDLMIA